MQLKMNDMYDINQEAMIKYNLRMGESIFEELQWMSHESKKSINRLILDAIDKMLEGN